MAIAKQTFAHMVFLNVFFYIHMSFSDTWTITKTALSVKVFKKGSMTTYCLVFQGGGF